MEERERYEWNSRFDEAIKDNQTGDIVNAVEVLNKQDKQIADLEVKLAESETDKKALISDYESRITKHQELMSWLEHNNEELKQQLAEKDKKIEKYRNANMIVVGERSQGKKHLMYIWCFFQN